MTVVIFGSQGNVGRRLRTAFPGHFGIDRVQGADLVADLATLDYDAGPVRDALEGCYGVIHVGTEPNPEAPDAAHFQAVIDAARLVAACVKYRVPRLVLPSSDWAAPKPLMGDINVYGQSKRVFETMADMVRQAGLHCTALRIGWVPHSSDYPTGAPQWLLDNYWDDDRVVAAFREALG